jgi:hypothetical protein
MYLKYPHTWTTFQILWISSNNSLWILDACAGSKVDKLVPPYYKNVHTVDEAILGTVVSDIYYLEGHHVGWSLYTENIHKIKQQHINTIIQNGTYHCVFILHLFQGIWLAYVSFCVIWTFSYRSLGSLPISLGSKDHVHSSGQEFVTSK